MSTITMSAFGFYLGESQPMSQLLENNFRKFLWEKKKNVTPFLSVSSIFYKNCIKFFLDRIH